MQSILKLNNSKIRPYIVFIYFVRIIEKYRDYDMIYLLTAIGLLPGGSSTVHIYAETMHRTRQITTNLEKCRPCPVFAGFTLAFALQLRNKHGKTSVRVRKTSEYSIHFTKTPTHYKSHTNTHTHTHPHITKQYKTTTVQIKTNTLQDIPK